MLIHDANPIKSPKTAPVVTQTSGRRTPWKGPLSPPRNAPPRPHGSPQQNGMATRAPSKVPHVIRFLAIGDNPPNYWVPKQRRHDITVPLELFRRAGTTSRRRLAYCDAIRPSPGLAVKDYS